MRIPRRPRRPNGQFTLGDTVRYFDRHDTIGTVVTGDTTIDPIRFVSVQWLGKKKPMLVATSDLERV